MKSLMGSLALAMLLTATTGCYCCRQCYDSCGGSSYSYKEWGFSKSRCGGCSTGCNGCDVGCTSAAPGCDMPCTADAGYGYDYAPPPTFQHNPGSPQKLPPAPAAPAADDAAPADPGFDIDETAGWAPTLNRHRVHSVR